MAKVKTLGGSFENVAPRQASWWINNTPASRPTRVLGLYLKFDPDQHVSHLSLVLSLYRLSVTFSVLLSRLQTDRDWWRTDGNVQRSRQEVDGLWRGVTDLTWCRRSADKTLDQRRPNYWRTSSTADYCETE